jgi:flavin reductase (DIM6/NTAB) family NADH-FMN oxidoreductase RutF
MNSFAPSSQESFLALARAWAATVTVVTVRRDGAGAGADVDGFTATAFFTVSMSPPIIAVSAAVATRASSMLRDSVGFAVNLLAPAQVELARAFARSHSERAAVLPGMAYQLDAAGVPLIARTAGAFSARVRQLVDAGDHILVLGDVTAIHVGESADTLVYHNRGFGRVVTD